MLLKHPLVKGWSIFVVFVAISQIFSEFPLYSWKKFGVFLFYSYTALFIGLFLYSLSPHRTLAIRRALYILAFSLVLTEFITISNVICGCDVLYYIKRGVIIPQAANYHLREVFVAISFFLIYDFFSRKSSLLIQLFFFVVPVLGILASTSRTAILSFLAALFVYTGLKVKKIFSKEILFTLLVITGVSLVAYVTFPEIKQRIDSFKTTFSPHGDRMTGRYDIYMDTIKRMQKNILTGYGVKSSVMFAQKKKMLGGIAKHPHNIFLEIFLDSGIIGFVGFLIFLWFIKNLFDLSLPVVSAVFIAIFLTSLVSWSIWSANHISIILFILTLLYGYVKQRSV
ncbi:O-antigen ligase family protein [Nitratiruptor sp. SB155-2]|uniref:O-antigen ligase family protein n=1 Tax=Nitratiruptor sp. (strain SB155-2) TaxID=387092 RepID=UPI001305477B|nr:O-antigen ligase family protein [Nitratiruptor sp. SB155-2]